MPSGTMLHVRLRQTISSFGSKQDTPISAIVIQPVKSDGQIALPMTTELHGFIARVRRVAVGLSHETAQLDLRLLRLTDSKPKVNPLFKLALKDLGLIVGAYQFGSLPPLEGGGIFQFGLQYGGGFKYQLTPRFFLRADFRQTLSPQPDYWTKSYPTIRKDLVEDPGDGVEIKPYQKFAPLRQNATTVGFGIPL